MDTSKESVAAALGRIPSGCSILTAEQGERSTGVLVSWVQQASFDPPMVSVCLKQERPAAALVEGTGRFLLNLLGSDPSSMFKHFGKGVGSGEDAFAGLEIEATEYGPLIKSCIAQLGCVVKNKVFAGDHDIYLAEIRAARGTEAEPYVHLRRNGFSY